MLPIGSGGQSRGIVPGHCCCPADSRACGAGSWDWQNSPVELGTGLWEVEHLHVTPDLWHLNKLMLSNWPWPWLAVPLISLTLSKDYFYNRTENRIASFYNSQNRNYQGEIG